MAREISKVHEEHRRGTLAEVAEWFREHEPKGEIVIVVAGAEEEKRVSGNKYKLEHGEEKGRGEGGEDFVTQ